MRPAVVRIDGGEGEGGGQVVRTSLALSAMTGAGLELTRIRAGRAKPGLRAQHLAAVQAVAKVCSAKLSSVQVGSTELSFEPGPIRGGRYHFSVGTAGSVGLVMHAVLPVLLTAKEPSEVTIEGGTHADKAPPFEHIEQAFLPALRCMGVQAEIELLSAGFFPRGGGRVRLLVQPWLERRRFERVKIGPKEFRSYRIRRAPWADPGPIEEVEAYLRKAGFQARPASELKSKASSTAHRSRQTGKGPPGAVLLGVGYGQVLDVASAMPIEHLSLLATAKRARLEAESYFAEEVPVGPHLADQLMLYARVGGGAEYLTGALSLHSKTQLSTLERFLGPIPRAYRVTDGKTLVSIAGDRRA